MTKYKSITSLGYQGAQNFTGLTGVKKPALSMMIRLLIDNSPPPLFLLINPSNLDLNFASKITKNKVRRTYHYEIGYVFEYHHDELDTMNVSCSTALFYNSKYGLTNQNLKQTYAYDQFQKLLAIYRNNGRNFDKKYDELINSIGRVLIQYDNIQYIGSFDEFSFTETSENPFNYNLTWTFTISETKDLKLQR